MTFLARGAKCGCFGASGLRYSPGVPAAAAGEASTEAEQDRSLRDALLDAMREGAPPGYDEPVSRYYEELLK